MKKLLLAASILAATSSVMAADATTEKSFLSGTASIKQSEYPTAETARQLLKQQDISGINKFQHKPTLTPTDNQPVVRMNRDTYYSMATVDVSEGAYITLPDVGDKYMTLQVVTEDHKIQPMRYGTGTYNLTTHVGTHVYALIRLDATLSIEEKNAIQAKMIITAKSDKLFKAEAIDGENFHKIEANLKSKVPAMLKKYGAEVTYGMFTSPTDSSKELFVQEKYEVGAALGWGGAQLVDNVYELSRVFPKTCHQMTFEDPKNKAFWSVTVYNKTGRMFNDLANISSNTASVNKDGTYTISFGCGGDAVNNISVTDGNETEAFTLAFRHYMPSQQIRDGLRLLPLIKEVK